MAITLDGTTGITTPGLTNTGTETLVNLTTTGNTILGDASTDTLNVGNGGLIKDASGNVGIGVTLSAWSVAYPNILQTKGGSLFGDPAGSEGNFGVNVYYNAGYKYAANGYASVYQQYNSQHIWKIAASGTAGNAITFTQAMTLDASGNLLIGTTTSNSFKFKVSDAGGAEFAFLPNDSGVNNFTNYNRSTSAYVPISLNAADVRFSTSGTERARIDSSGNLLVGTTSSSGSASNTAIAISGAFQTASGSVSAPSSTPTAVATLPNVNYGTWIVNIALSTGVAATWSSNYILNTQGTSSNIGTLLAGSGSGLGISMSGLSLRVQQGSGATQTVYWSITRIF